AHPPAHEVEIHERTSWSCAHGVERWRADCGCRTRSDWHQRWRAPLREALDWLGEQIDACYEARASAHLKDPWAARDAYVDVVLVRRLAAAPSNLPEYGDGARVWGRLVRPTAVDFRRVIAHYAISGVFEEQHADARVYAWRIARLDEARETADGAALRVARVRLQSEVTGETREAVYALGHYGAHDFSCGIRPWEGAAAYEALKTDLLRRL